MLCGQINNKQRRQFDEKVDFENIVFDIVSFRTGFRAGRGKHKY
jgi:hypothetical protein